MSELEEYFNNAFSVNLNMINQLPLKDEGFVEVWREYLNESNVNGVFNTLKKHLPQLNFAIEKGMSQNAGYRAATLSEKIAEKTPDGKDFHVNRPDDVKLFIHETPAGSIPVIIVYDREDFVSFFRALACKNEPVEIPASTGACAVKGFNNLERLKNYKDKWVLENPFEIWELEFENLSGRKEIYQDSFLLLSDGPYSGVPACALGFETLKWREASLKIRLGHESAHYLTRRCLGSMRNHAHDELIADYAGICHAFGEYKSSLFLKFCGIEKFPEIEPGGRINNYKGKPSLSEEAFQKMCGVLHDAALNVELFDGRNRRNFSGRDFTTAAILCLASLRLDEIAEKNSVDVLEKLLSKIKMTAA